MITIEFPDNTIKKFPKGITCLDIAKYISEGLARNVLAAKINGITIDLNHKRGVLRKITHFEVRIRSFFIESMLHQTGSE